MSTGLVFLSGCVLFIHVLQVEVLFDNLFEYYMHIAYFLLVSCCNRDEFGSVRPDSQLDQTNDSSDLDENEGPAMEPDTVSIRTLRRKVSNKPSFSRPRIGQLRSNVHRLLRSL